MGLEDVTKIVFEIAGEETEEFIQLEASIVGCIFEEDGTFISFRCWNPRPTRGLPVNSLQQIASLPGREAIKLFSCSTQLSMKFFMLLNVKMPTIVGILTFRSGKNSILGLCEPKNGQIS